MQGIRGVREWGLIGLLSLPATTRVPSREEPLDHVTPAAAKYVGRSMDGAPPILSGTLIDQSAVGT